MGETFTNEISEREYLLSYRELFWAAGKDRSEPGSLHKGPSQQQFGSGVIIFIPTSELHPSPAQALFIFTRCCALWKNTSRFMN